MEFYTVSSQKRPVRLSEETRRFAWASLHGKYGDQAMESPAVCMGDVPGFSAMTPLEQYDAAVIKIAQEAPVRICPEERVSGSATLGKAIEHVIPAIYHGAPFCGSISHVTLDFAAAVRGGVHEIERKLQQRLARPVTSEQERQLRSMQGVIDAMRIWHKRYLDALQTTKPEIYQRLLRVPFEPPRDFREAVQSLWFLFAFTRLYGTWSGIGRIDEILGEYLKRDLESGAVTMDEAREFLASFWIKGCEWIQKDTPAGSGDAQHYQNIVLAGIDKDGNEITNEVTYLVLDIVEELGISDFPISVRISPASPPRLLRRIAQVMRHGGGVVAVYNEPLILESLTAYGYPEKEARGFANDGCWEVQIPGKTLFFYSPFDCLQLLLEDTLRLSAEEPAHFSSMEDLYAAFYKNLKAEMERIYQERISTAEIEATGHGWYRDADTPCSVASLFEEGCIESGCSYLMGGPVYSVLSPHIGGAPDAGNSLYAIQKLVFEEQKVTFDELIQILKQNWDGQELLRQYVKNRYTYYGNDNDESDAYTVRIYNDFADLVLAMDGRGPIRFVPGVSTFGRQIEWAPIRAAVPFGYKKGEILSGNASPTPGTDAEGATAIIKSYCKADLKKQVNGAALDVKLHPSCVEGENGIAALVALMQGFVALGGSFLQLDVMDAEILRRAQEDPEAYKTLSVRVSGWNARFVTLDKEWRQMILERTAQSM